MMGYGGHNVKLEQMWQNGGYHSNMVPWEFIDPDDGSPMNLTHLFRGGVVTVG